MRRNLLYSLAITLSLTVISCEEWDPVIGNQGEPQESAASSMQANTTIQALKELYKGKPVHIEQDLIIEGQVISSDVSGNIYRSLYIQDDSGAIEVKIGNSGLYNDYKVGQLLYVKCQGLVLGNYGGMLQIGADDPTGEYETAYIDVKSLINSHVFKGPKGTPLNPQVVTRDQVNEAVKAGYKSPLLGKLVTLNGLTYANEIFVLIYLNPNLDKKASSNRLFLSDKQWGVNTWAFSAAGMKNYLLQGFWNDAKIGNSGDYNYGTAADAVKVLEENAAAYAVSQYFDMPMENGKKVQIQIRSSGYAKFADTPIDKAILDGAKVNVTGILTNYNGAAQFTLIDLDGVKIAN
ncbi:MAG: hypothetical protein J6N54_08180 [Bacteroidales bacterium]|nr:hypothetical protein [Bacteroidales bacterium]